MHTQEEMKDAAKLYELLFHGANLYSATNKSGQGDQAMRRYIEVIREYNAYKGK